MPEFLPSLHPPAGRIALWPGTAAAPMGCEARTTALTFRELKHKSGALMLVQSPHPRPVGETAGAIFKQARLNLEPS